MGGCGCGGVGGCGGGCGCGGGGRWLGVGSGCDVHAIYSNPLHDVIVRAVSLFTYKTVTALLDTVNRGSSCSLFLLRFLQKQFEKA